jgi:hypothetical protein
VDRRDPEINKLESASSFTVIDRCADVVLKTAALLGVSSVVISLCRLTWLCSESELLGVFTLFAALVAVGIFAIALSLMTSFFGDYRNANFLGSNWRSTVGNILTFALLAMIEISFIAIGWYWFISNNGDFTCA